MGRMGDRSISGYFARVVTDLQNPAKRVLALDLSSEEQRFYWRFCNSAIRVRAILEALPQVVLAHNYATV